jgi:hypothetical protein
MKLSHVTLLLRLYPRQVAEESRQRNEFFGNEQESGSI